MASGDLTGRIIGRYQDETFFSPLNLSNLRQGAYTTFDATLKYQRADSNWSVEAYVNNLTDKKRFAFAEESTVYYTYTYSYAPPRTYGVRVSAEF